MRIPDLSCYIHISTTVTWLEDMSLKGLSPLSLFHLGEFVNEINRHESLRANDPTADLKRSVADLDIYITKTPFTNGNGDIVPAFGDTLLLTIGWFVTASTFRAIIIAPTTLNGCEVLAAAFTADVAQGLQEDGKYAMVHSDYVLNHDPSTAIRQMVDVYLEDKYSPKGKPNLTLVVSNDL